MKKSKKKKSSSKAKSGKSDKKKSKAKKEPRVTRKGFILDQIRDAGKKGITMTALTEATDSEFNYGEGKSSRMRVGNTVKEAVGDGTVKKDKDTVVWKG